jgi:L-ribulokinase
LRDVAVERGEKFLSRYGGKVSSEWMIPKVWQVLEEAPQVYRKTHRFIEAGDWMVLQMTGREMRSSCNAGYKAIWDKREGYPSPEFFASLNPQLKDVVSEKLSSSIYSPGTPAGGLTPEIAKITGLKEGTPVAVGIIDAHAAVPGCSVTEPGKMVMIMGTSTCHMLLSAEGKAISGIPGVVEDGILQGFFGYEAGQAAVGDSFNWFVSNCIPGSYDKEALERNMDIYSLLEEKASALKPGGKGLIALDWWNGNRSVLNNADLSGMILGLTLNTRPEDIFRALLESTAFGTRMIIETFEEHGVPIDELYACGGMPHKDRLMMQIYADVTGRDIRVTSSRQASALGAAMMGSLAAGRDGGGFDSITEAVKVMASPEECVYSPVEENVRTYDHLYAEFRKLHDHFGRGGNPVMEFLKRYKG